MLLSKLTEHLLMYIVTGFISFLVALGYTSYRLAPGRNVTLVPHTIKLPMSDRACTVDREKLTAAIQRTDESESTPFPPDTYEFYLKTLSSFSGELVQHEFVPPKFLLALEKDEILRCNESVEGITFEIAALLNQPTPYLMWRSCSMSYHDAELPIRASDDAGATHRGSVEQETLMIRETINLTFAYNQNEKDKIAKSTFADLVQKVKDIKLSAKCRVIGAGYDTPTEVGGRPYPVDVVRLSQ